MLPQVQAFLSILEKAHNAGLGRQFGRFTDAFIDEVDAYIDENLWSLSELVLEMEDFMNHMDRKKGKK